MLLSERSCVSESVFVCCLQVCLAWKTISCQTDTGNRVKRSQFSQGTCGEDDTKYETIIQASINNLSQIKFNLLSGAVSWLISFPLTSVKSGMSSDTIFPYSDLHTLTRSLLFYKWHEFHEACHSVTFYVLVNSHQRWKQTRNRVCFHLWCELTLALWCHSIVWSPCSRNKT